MSYLSRVEKCYKQFSLNQEELAYYARHILLPSVGLEGQRKLKASRLLIVGAGGLGCPVLQSLSGAGVGHLTIIDGDVVSASNLSRQWLHSIDDVGLNKATSAKVSAESLNPYIDLTAVDDMLSEDNAKALIESHDLVVDATDNLDVRYLIDDVCAEVDRPWVHAALYRESSQLTVFWNQFGSNFRKLYPEPSAAPSCSGAGMLGASASFVGNLQALEAVKLITGNGKLMLGELVSVNAQGLEVQRFELPDISSPKPLLCEDKSKESKCSISLTQLEQALSIHEPCTLVALHQFECPSGLKTIQLSEESLLEAGIPDHLSGKVVLVCEEGVTSSVLAEAISTFDDRAHYLVGGARALGKLA